MAGWPNRLSRSALGLPKINRAAIINPRECVPAEEYMLLSWQAIGAAVASPEAWVLINSSGARQASGEAWNPNGDDALRPTTSRTSTGIYVFTYAGSYPDHVGTDTPFSLNGCAPSVQSSTAGLTATWTKAGNVFTVKVATGGGTLTDAGVLLTVF